MSPWIPIIILFLAGVLASAGFIIKKKPEAKDLIDKIVPFQGIIGIVAFVWGVIELILNILPNIRLLLAFPQLGIPYLAVVVMLLLLGFLLGFGLISKYALGKSEAAKAKAEQLLKKLVSVQIPLGLIGILLAVGLVVVSFMFRPA